MFVDETVPTVEQVVSQSVVLSSKNQNWPGVEVMQARFDFNELIVPALASHTIVLNLGQPFGLNSKIEGRKSFGGMSTGGAKIVPAGLPSEWHWAEGTKLHVLHLSLNSTFTEEVISTSDLNPARVELLTKVGISDPQIEQLGRAFLAELALGGIGNKIYTESLANILIVHLLRYYSSLRGSNVVREYTGPLPRQTLQLVIDYINENLAQDLRLNEIAKVSNLSPYYFSRLFKQSTGYSPHQYVIKCRLERAKLLLTTTTFSLQEIAASTGFTDQSHLARQFQTHFGFSPSTLRRI